MFDEKVHKKEYLEKDLKELTEKKWSLESEVRYQKRWMSVDLNKKSFVQGQEIFTRDYIKMLERDLNYLDGKIGVVKDEIKEL